jgi:hypothetical protein
MKKVIQLFVTVLFVTATLSIAMPTQAATKFKPDLIIVFKPAFWTWSGFQPAGIYVRNQGTAHTGSRFNVALYLTELPTPSQTIKLGTLSPGQETHVLSLNPMLPITAVCPKAVADSTNAVAESNEGNNTLFFGGIGFCG